VPDLRGLYALVIDAVSISDNTASKLDDNSIMAITGKIFILSTGSTALRFKATGAPTAARRIQILPVNQHAYRLITLGRSSYNPQIIGGGENAVPVHVDILRNQLFR
jgi:hypothetical protein